MWDLLTKKCVATLDKHFSTVTSMAVSEDGRTLLTAGRDKVRKTLALWPDITTKLKPVIVSVE